MSCIILFPNQLFEKKYIDMLFKEIDEKNKNVILNNILL